MLIPKLHKCFTNETCGIFIRVRRQNQQIILDMRLNKARPLKNQSCSNSVFEVVFCSQISDICDRAKVDILCYIVSIYICHFVLVPFIP